MPPFDFLQTSGSMPDRKQTLTECTCQWGAVAQHQLRIERLLVLWSVLCFLLLLTCLLECFLEMRGADT